MDSEGTKRKKRKKSKKRTLLDPEEVYSDLLSQYNTSLAETLSGSYPAATPMKRHTEESSPEAESQRKVLFNLKLNRTQHFHSDDVVGNTDLTERFADLSPAKSVLKTDASEKVSRKKRKGEDSQQ